MPRDDTVIYYLSRRYLYLVPLRIEHFESTNELFLHHKKRAQKRSPNNERKEARKKKKKKNINTTTNVSLDASSVRFTGRERVSRAQRGAVFGTEKLESIRHHVGIRFRARV